MNKDQKEGYRKALKDVLDELAEMHKDFSTQIPVRKVVDRVWSFCKKKLNELKNS